MVITVAILFTILKKIINCICIFCMFCILRLLDDFYCCWLNLIHYVCFSISVKLSR